MKTVQHLINEKAIKHIWQIAPNATVINALELMAQKSIGALLVVENQKLVGIFSERDYARKGIIQGRKATETLINEVMTEKVITVPPKTSIQECMQIFSDKKFRHLPVVDGEEILGILSVGDIVSSIINDQKEHINFLEQYIKN